MSAAGSAERIGVLERLTDSTVFAVLFVCAALVLGPILLFGLAMLPLSLTQALRTIHSDALTLALLPLGGAAGFIGLFLTTRPPETLAGYRILMLCIALGIATAIVMAGGFIANAASTSLGGGDSFWFNALGVFVLAIPVLAALGRVARLWRLRAAAEGRAQDALPLIFLAVALGELACAIVIGARFAMAG